MRPSKREKLPCSEVGQSIVSELRFISTALRGEAEEVAQGKSASPQLLALAGWTIYRAEKAGQLSSILALEQSVDAALLQSMDKGVPMRLREQAIGTGTPIMRDSGKTIEQFLQEFGTKAKEQAAQSASVAIDGIPFPLPADPDIAAQCLVGEVWRTLSNKYRGSLPPDIARLYLHGHPLSDLLAENSAGFRKAAWVCEFLADAVDRGVTNDDPDWLTVTDAANRFRVHSGELSRACDQGKIDSNKKNGRDRRLKLSSVATWIGKKDARAAAKEKNSVRLSEDEERGSVVCLECGRIYPVKPAKCLACEGHKFEPNRRRS